jgi:hypothetical protein
MWALARRPFTQASYFAVLDGRHRRRQLGTDLFQRVGRSGFVDSLKMLNSGGSPARG